MNCPPLVRPQMEPGRHHKGKENQWAMNLQRVTPRGENLVVAVLWLCLGYTLSIGPAFYVARETGSGSQWMRTIYAPLFWLHDNTTLDTPLKWYAETWEEGAAAKARPAVAQRRLAHNRPSAGQR